MDAPLIVNAACAKVNAQQPCIVLDMLPGFTKYVERVNDATGTTEYVVNTRKCIEESTENYKRFRGTEKFDVYGRLSMDEWKAEDASSGDKPWVWELIGDN